MMIRRQYYKIHKFNLLIAVTILLTAVFATEAKSSPQIFNSQLKYLESIHDTGPISDPQLIFSLALQYLNTNQHEVGIEFFDSFIKGNDSRLSDEKKAFYLSALGLLRGSFANQTPFLSRIGWVNETIEILENARALTNNNEFLIRWSTGVVYSQLPAFFKKRDTAIEDLKWSVKNISGAPHIGWIREVYFRLGFIFNKLNDQEQAGKFLELSGYNDFDKQIILTTPYSANQTKGSTFHPKRLVA